MSPFFAFWEQQTGSVIKEEDRFWNDRLWNFTRTVKYPWKFLRRKNRIRHIHASIWFRKLATLVPLAFTIWSCWSLLVKLHTTIDTICIALEILANLGLNPCLCPKAVHVEQKWLLLRKPCWTSEKLFAFLFRYRSFQRLYPVAW